MLWTRSKLWPRQASRTFTPPTALAQVSAAISSPVRPFPTVLVVTRWAYRTALPGTRIRPIVLLYLAPKVGRRAAQLSPATVVLLRFWEMGYAASVDAMHPLEVLEICERSIHCQGGRRKP